MKLLSLHSLVVFKFMSLNITDNLVNLVESTYNKVSASVEIVSYTCAWENALAPTSQIMTSNLSSSSQSSMVESTTFLVQEIVGKC